MNSLCKKWQIAIHSDWDGFHTLDIVVYNRVWIYFKIEMFEKHLQSQHVEHYDRMDEVKLCRNLGFSTLVAE